MSIVLGAGLTGLSYAYRKLEKSREPVIIFEKDGTAGGLMKTYGFGDFFFDFGPHIFRSKDEKVMAFIKNLLGSNYHHVSSNPIISKSNQFFDNVIPAITYKNIHSLHPGKRDQVTRELANLEKELNLDNFKDCIISQVGETLYWEFFGEYSKKWWGLDPASLSADLAPKNLKIRKVKSYGHISTNFDRLSYEIYPLKGGIFEICKALESRVKSLGGQIIPSSKVTGLEIDGDKITKIIITHNGEETEVASVKTSIISTLPITYLCDMLKMKNDLEYRGDICVFLKLDGERLLDSSWTYFHDSNIIFSRLYEPSYFSKHNSSKGYTSLCAEVTCFQNDSTWSNKSIGEKVLEHLISFGLIKKSQNPAVLGIAKFGYAYPIYTISYREKLKEILEKLSSIKNLQIIGRTGSFSYQNMSECLEWAVC
jgi:protoporphyrinogen oxidase